jgi:hypothetical protein
MAWTYWIDEVIKLNKFFFEKNFFCRFSVERAFVNVDGKLLERLYQMKQLAADSYYKFLDKYFDRIQIARMCDTLKFDYELESLFQ